MLPVSNDSKNITSLQFISLLLMRSLLLVAKPVSWMLDPDRPRKTGSRYNDTLMHRKANSAIDNVTVLFHCLLDDF